MPSNSIQSSQKQYFLPSGPVLNQNIRAGEFRTAKTNPVAKGPTVEFQPPTKNVRLMSEYGANITKGFVSLFSLKTFKSIGAKTMLFATGIAGGVAIGALAGPPLYAALTGLAASAVFPPVAIAIGATLGAALLVFGIYKLVQKGKAKLKDEAAAREALAQSQNQQMQAPQNEAVYASSIKSEKYSIKPESVKSKAPSSFKAQSVAKSAARGTPMAPVPELSLEEQQAWSKGNTFNN